MGPEFESPADHQKSHTPSGVWLFCRRGFGRSVATVRGTVAADGSTEANNNFRISENANERGRITKTPHALLGAGRFLRRRFERSNATRTNVDSIGSFPCPVCQKLIVFNSLENIGHQSSRVHIENILPFVMQDLLGIFHKTLVGHMQSFSLGLPFLFVKEKRLQH